MDITQAEEVDLQLVLAVDASGSVDEQEFDLQMRGIAQAFRDAEVRAAISAGPLAKIAVAVVIWAEANYPKGVIGWFAVSDRASAEVFAAALDGRGRGSVEGGTGIGHAIAESVWLIESNGYESLRKVIDLSGDGRETPPREFTVLVDQARILSPTALLWSPPHRGLSVLPTDRL